MSDADRQREALRQQMLLRAILHDARSAVVGGWLRDGAGLQRGLQAYQANAGALAERAPAAAFPVLQQLLGDESFAAMARAFWHARPPVRGDIAEWGAALPDFIADDEQLAGEPYLADVARLEWAVHTAERAADAMPTSAIERLAGSDPAALRLVLQPGCAVVVSPHPIVAVWQAHHSSAPDRFLPVREAFAEARAETALVWRDGWKAAVHAIPAAEARFTQALLARRPLAAALDAAGATFEFEPWLVAALRAGRIATVEEIPA